MLFFYKNLSGPNSAREGEKRRESVTLSGSQCLRKKKRKVAVTHKAREQEKREAAVDKSGS
ncbi:hypothetical protein V7161_02225, partial [Neobacillus drentensis]|uniref:hypothetical protein n=1 Tax=Neobacillus drentensis TaxID=220684 RepID=UPI0030008EFD